ncbi:glycosyltransferase [Geodermatophilus sp. URMC 65]
MPLSIAYLSGALRVSTTAGSATLGPRSHILGWISGARGLGHSVTPLIAGDLVQRGAASAPDSLVRGSLPKRLIADGTRVLGNRAMQALALARMRACELDLVYERHGAFQAVGRPLASRRRIPWVLESNGIFYREAALDRQSLALQRLARHSELSAYTSADLVVCVSDRLAEEIDRLTVGAAKTLVLPNGVDTELFAPADCLRVQTPKDDRLRIGFVGSVVEWQNLPRLLRVIGATSHLRDRFHVTIVGDGPGRNAVEATARQYRLGSASVSVTGRLPLEQVPRIIESFDVCYSGHLPTRAGGMYHSPLKTYEYLAMGKPVLASDHPEARSMAARVPGIHLFSSTSDEGLAQLLTELKDRTTLTSGSSERRDWVVSEHSWRRRVEDLLAAIP